MSLLGKKIKLQGITAKGKNRVREHGNEWTVLAHTDKVLFSPEKADWIFIAPLGKDQNDKSSRWCKLSNDPDFNVVIQAD